MPQAMQIQGHLTMNQASLNHSAKQVQQALGRITGKASEFQKSLDASTARVFAFGATTSVLNAVNQSFKQLVVTTIDVQKRLVEINSIFQASAKTFNEFRNSIFQVAKDTGQTFATVADGAAELARQGLSAAETAKRLEASLILTRISGLDAEKSVKALTAAINGFTSETLTAEQIVNKMVAVDTAFAVSAQDLADGFSRAGSTAEDAGVSFDELLGLITAVEQKTARGGAVIGNAFKSIFTRLSRGDTISQLKDLGVEIDASQNGVQKLQALANALDNISDPTVASKIKELAGGVFQINVVSAALKDLASDTSLFRQAAETAAGATNEAFSKNEALNKTLAAQINALVAGLTDIGEKIGSVTFAPLLENLVSIATKFSSVLESAMDPEKGNAFIKGIFKSIGAFISGPGLVLITTAFLKITTLIAKFAKDGFVALMQIGSEQEKIKNIEEGIVRLLQQDENLRNTINSSTATQAQKEEAVIKAIQKENQLLTTQANILRSIAALAAQRGVMGYDQSKGFTGKKGRTFASGFQQEEAMAMALGASSNVSAHYGKGTIGGRRFIMNDQEVEIPGFGRNGDSAVIPMYAKGKKPITKTIPRSFLKNYHFLVPQIGKRGETQLRELDGVRYEGGSPVSGPDPNQIDKISDKEEASLENRVTNSVLKETSGWINRLKPLGQGASTSLIRANFMKEKGAYGALQSAIGGAFEVATKTALNYEAQQSDVGGDFDVRGGTNIQRIRDLFARPDLNVADMKNQYNPGREENFYKAKVQKEYNLINAPKVSAAKKNTKAYRESAAGKAERRARRMKRLGRASGHIPKFAKGTSTGGGMGGGMGTYFAFQAAMSATTAIVDSSTQKRQEELDAIKEKIDAQKKEIDESGKSIKQKEAEKAAIDQKMKLELDAAKQNMDSAQQMSDAAQKFIKTLMVIQTLDMFSGGRMMGKIASLFRGSKMAKMFGGAKEKALKGLTRQRSLAGMFSGRAGVGMAAGRTLGTRALAAAGPIGGVIGAATLGWSAGKFLGDKIVAAKEKKYDAKLEQARLMGADSAVERNMKAIQRQSLGGMSQDMVLQELRGFGQSTLAETIEKSEKALKEAYLKNDMVAYGKLAEEYRKALEQAIEGLGSGAFRDLQYLKGQLGIFKTLLKENVKDMQGRMKSVTSRAESTQFSYEVLGSRASAYNVAGMDTAISSQTKIAETRAEGARMRELRNQLQNPNLTDEERGELREKIGEASKEFYKKVVESGAYLRNNVKQLTDEVAAKQIEVANIYREMISNRVQQTANFMNADYSLDSLVEAMGDMKNASPEEAAKILQQISGDLAKAESQIGPEVIDILAKNAGMTPEQWGSVAGGARDFSVGNIAEEAGLRKDVLNLIQNKEKEPLDEAKEELSQLKSSLKSAQTSLDDFSKAFETDAIKEQQKRITESLNSASKSLDGYKEFTKALGDLNKNTQGVVAANAKAMADLKIEQDKLQDQITEVQSKIDSMTQP